MEEVTRWPAIVCLGAILLAPSGVAAQSAPHEGPRLAQASGASNEHAQEARSRYERGLQLYNEGASEGALVEFERAYQLAPSYRLLYNIALIRLQLNDYARALGAFQEYLAEGGTDISSVRRSEVERHLAALRSKVGRVELISSARGAEVLVDDVVVGKVPLAEPLVLNPGRRRVTITRGGLSSSAVVAVAGQDASKIELSLDSPRPQSTTGALVALSPSRTPAYVSWSVTVALAAATTVVGILALDAMSDLDKEQAKVPTTRARLDAAHSKMMPLAVATDILAGATAIAGATALYFTLSKPSTETSLRQGGTRVGFGFTTLQLEHRF
ncbi:MAG TPA: tetratricopeptide repeat protein [Polyangiaceae bacterium]|nr:tetratricopeptide repeat protein [Polyangiaceae bacterium]